MNRWPLFQPESPNEDRQLCYICAIYNLDCKARAGNRWSVAVEVCDEEKAAFSCRRAYAVKNGRKTTRSDRDDSWKP